MRESIVGKHVGTRVKRLEDRRLLTGRGTYVDDVVVPDMLHATFLRSPHPHAELGAVDTTAAAAMAGVIAVFTGADMRRLTNPMMGMMALPGLYDPWFWCLAADRVRYVGDPVAIVVAESRAVAEDACDLIEVDYRPLDPISTRSDTLDPARPPIWPLAQGNTVCREVEDFGDTDAAFAQADRVVRTTIDVHRHANQPMETQGSVAEVRADGTITLHVSHQSGHALKWGLAMVLTRKPFRAVVRGLWQGRDRLRKVGTFAAAFLKARPALVDAQKQSLPLMMKANLRDRGRARWSTQAMLSLLSEDPGGLVEVRVRDVGGGFGTKTAMLREHAAVAVAARELGRSVKWIEDRNEHLISGGQAREESFDLEAAVTDTGIILGLRVALTMDMGAYPSYPYGAAFFCRMIRVMFPGPYRIPAMRFDTRIVTSNKATYSAYRGPWASETFARERLLDIIAREVGISAAEIRRRNMIGPDELPTRMITGPPLDVRVSAKTTLQRALEIAEYDSWAEQQAAARAEGRYLGLGISTYIEAAPGPTGYYNYLVPGFADMVTAEPAHTVLEADGSITIHTAQVPHGQSHETTMAQIAADELGVRVEDITMRYGDTRISPFGIIGTGGSRSAALHGGANALSARALRREIVDIAAAMLEADPAEIDILDGNVHVRGVAARGLTFAEIATEAKRLGVGRRAGTRAVGDEAIRVARGWDGGEGGWSQSTHACWVEVDLDTGFVTIPRYVVVEDCGEIINPAIVDGQVRGGVAQGVGAVLYEKSTYDSEGQMAAGTFMDYLIPTASEIPHVEIHHVETPSDIPFNYRGVGEGGMIGAPAAITNAIENALGDLGVQIREEHLPPSRILELLGRIPVTAPA